MINEPRQKQKMKYFAILSTRGKLKIQYMFNSSSFDEERKATKLQRTNSKDRSKIKKEKSLLYLLILIQQNKWVNIFL